MSQPKGKLKLYGCGGAGINLAHYFQGISEDPNCAVVDTSYIDTSMSNLRGEKKQNIDEEQIYILKNVDGSGKLRREHHIDIANVVKQVLVQHEPSDFNVVMFSAAGGSGSVIGPLIVSELLARGLPVVSVIVGSDESVIAANNTLNTLKSLEAIARKQKAPAVIAYQHNSRAESRSEVDAKLIYSVAALSVLVSQRNSELDTKDITNWIHFQKVTSVNPQLARLEIYKDEKAVNQSINPVSIASIYRNPDQPHIEAIAEYDCYGFCEQEVTGSEDIHYVISVDDVPEITRGIQATLEDMQKVTASRPAQSNLVDASDEQEDSGLIL